MSDGVCICPKLRWAERGSSCRTSKEPAWCCASAAVWPCTGRLRRCTAGSQFCAERFCGKAAHPRGRGLDFKGSFQEESTSTLTARGGNGKLLSTPTKGKHRYKKRKKTTHHGQLEPLLVTTSKSAWRFKGQPFPGRQLHAQAPRVLPTPGWDEDESPAGWAAESFLPDVGKDTGSSSG